MCPIALAVSYTHLDVYKRQVWRGRLSNYLQNNRLTLDENGVMMKSIKTWLLLACVVLIGLGAWLAYYAVTPLKLAPSSQEIVIQPKSGLKSIANQLVAQGVIQEPWRFIVLAKLLNKESTLQAGNYTLNKNVSPYQLLLSLNNGKATQGSITFIEGRTFAQMREKMARNDALKQTVSTLSETEILKLVGSNRSKAEGLFFPDTFYFCLLYTSRCV